MASRILSRSFKNLTSLYKTSNICQNLVKQPKLVFPSLTNLNNRFFSTTLTSLQEKQNVYNELNAFLAQEIKLENEARKNKPILQEIKGFNLKAEGPNVTLTKSFKNENITIKLNVNHSLESPDNVEQAVESVENQAPMELKSRPSFTIDIQKNNETLSFSCTFLPPEEGGKDLSEDFQIDEFAIHGGEWDENVYTVDCSVLDGQLYDILMNVLEERGIGEEFANQLAEFSTFYEHKQYVDLLEKLKNFSK